MDGRMSRWMGGWMCGWLNGWMKECHLRRMCKVPKKHRAGLANVTGKEGRSLHGKEDFCVGSQVQQPLCIGPSVLLWEFLGDPKIGPCSKPHNLGM